VLDILFDCLTAWLAPFICFTAEEAWLARHPGEGSSVHLRLFPALPQSWRDDALDERFALVRRLRRVVTGALEVERAARKLGSSLQARAIVHAGFEYHDAMRGLDLAELCITSAAEMAEGPAPDEAFRLADVPGVAVVVAPAEGRKCERCWQVLPEVGQRPDHPEICGRCADAVAHRRAAAE
jgi:isoleucyl-tRNA synthetase